MWGPGRRRRAWIPALVLWGGAWAWAGCGGEPTESAEALSDAYARAVEEGDLAALSELVCWERVDARGREAFERGLREQLGLGVSRTTLEPLPDSFELEYQVDGVTYRPNLEPVARMRVEFDASPDGPPRPRSTSHLLAVREGAYCITLNAPVASNPGP
jgi:hypothetical protein